MELQELHRIIELTTYPLRKGEVLEKRQTGDVQVTEIYDYPHEKEWAEEMGPVVDLHFIKVGVDLEKAEELKDELVEAIKNDYRGDLERLKLGPSYIELGAGIGDQGYALRLIALGDALKLWDAITPAALGIEGELANQMAGSGGIMMTGLRQ